VAVALSLLVAALSLTGLLAGGGSLAVVTAALATPLGVPGGLAWAFHLGVVGVLVGTWLLGLGLLVDGLG